VNATCFTCCRMASSWASVSSGTNMLSAIPTATSGGGTVVRTIDSAALGVMQAALPGGGGYPDRLGVPRLAAPTSTHPSKVLRDADVLKNRDMCYDVTVICDL